MIAYTMQQLAVIAHVRKYGVEAEFNEAMSRLFTAASNGETSLTFTDCLSIRVVEAFTLLGYAVGGTTSPGSFQTVSIHW